MKALVTGGAGFIGSHLVDWLVTIRHDVTIYDLQPHEWVPSVRGDLMDLPRLIQAMQGKDVVFHVAGFPSVRNENAAQQLEQNLRATQNVLEAMRAASILNIVFSSTSAVYGNTTVFPTPEDCPFPVQTSLYGASKVASESIIAAYARTFGMHATIFRFAPVLGERYHSGHLYDFWRKLKSDPKHVEVLGDGQQRRSYVYVGDVIDAVLLAGWDSLVPVRLFNVGHHESCTVDQSLTWLCESLGLNPERTYTGKSWAGDKPLTLLDCTRLRDLGWEPQVTIKEAVFRTVRSFEG